MSVLPNLLTGLCLLLLSAAALAEAQLRVRVEPANSALKSNIEGYIGSLGERDAEALQRYRRVAENQAEKAAQALGYYQAQITTEVSEGTTPRLTLRIQPGEPVRLRDVLVRVEGPAAQLRAFRTPNDPQLRSGAPLNHGRYEAAKREIQNQASRYGFFAGRFSSQRLTIDPDAGIADIELIYLSGPRYQLGAVSFVGDAPFDEQLLQRMVPFPADSPYDSALIAELYQALRSSGYFESVQVDANPGSAAGEQIPVQVQLQARKPRSMGLGLGFSTDVGPRGRANWTRHWANPQGHSYGAELELSAPRQNVGLWYDVPLDPPLTDKLRVAGGYQAEDLANTDSSSRLLTFGPEWHSKLDSGWQRVLSLKWRHEQYDLGDDAGTSTLLMPGLSYSYLHSDNQIDPNHGYRLQLDLSGAAKGLLSDANVLHGNIQLKGLTTVFNRHRLLGRVQVGGTESDGFAKVPPSLRFFAGGDQSVRGYDYQSLSPENRAGDKIGGRYLFTSSLEYQYSLTERWRLASFFDQGNTFDSLQIPSLKSTVGVGVRWVSPLGPLRLDLAHPLDDQGGVRLHFSMGPEL
ncbi:MAG: autotransporter assembly complex family protein [Pseudomonas sp.]|uniref:autotransporter assembly complex protein TamA n=1 Tax=Pseudomonas sp. TaxID=306 RepID=UPI00271C1646|nr:autotransporter assembly complex family protein [Pseudomonas sp.]MDO9619117.1 autotransporter assembly complex family protein [Pseudomonas sp.]MDP2446617.1 autotransporter assembly complex family protein [Pseudomonas sp.]MDZ4337571.1 autotransporter assembly complex family protein [Pseudomonas sp.]